MKQNKYEKLFDNFMGTIEFALIKYPDDTWGVRDIQGANLGDIESDRFGNAAGVLDRMNIYIYDYFVRSLEECLEAGGFKVPDLPTFSGLADYARPLLPDSKWDCDIIDMICNHFEEINLNNCDYESEET